MSRRTRSVLIVLLVGTVVFLLDRLTKTWVLNNLDLYEGWAPIAALAPYFQFFHSTNTGMSFGLFQNGSFILTIVAVVAVVGILIYSFYHGQNSYVVDICLGMMLGGAAGNLFDRLVYGNVIDFISVGIPDVFRFATFNIADSSLVVGTIALAIYFLLEERKENADKQSLPDQA